MIGARGRVACGVAAIAFAATGCSALLSWDDFGGGSDAGGDSLDGAADAAPTPTTCAAPSRCMAAPPAGWAGPIAIFESATGQGAPAPCGVGFEATPVFDGYAELTAPASTCAACACGAPANVTCSGPVLTFFSEQSCATPCGTPVEVGATCAIAGPTCRGVIVGAPQARGGTCAPSGGKATTAPLAWAKSARACAPSVTPYSANCAGG